MRVLITGASGLIGGRLMQALLADGTMRVRAASRTSRAWPSGVEECVLEPDDGAAPARACQGVDVVINLASMPEASCAADPAGAVRANVGGTCALAAAAKTGGVRRFVQVSTAKVYGDNLAGVVTEDTPTSPISPYAITHRAAEDCAREHASGVVLRLANGFGAPADRQAAAWNVMVNDFCRQAVASRRIAIRSDGQSWRNFVPMNDVIAALHAAATNLPAGTYNVGAATAQRISEIAERVAAECQRGLGFRPEVSVGASTAGSFRARLDYRTDRLRDAGVSLNAPMDEEIRRTLLAAHRAVGTGVPD